MNRGRRQRRPRKVVGGKERRRIAGVDAQDVDDDALEDDKGAGRIEDDADDRHDPVHVRPGRPAEEEQAEWGGEDGEEGWDETKLQRAGRVGWEGRVEAESEVEAIGQYTDDDSDDDADKD